MEGALNSEARKRQQEARGEREPRLLTEWHPVYTELVPAKEYYIDEVRRIELIRQDLQALYE